MFTYFIISLFFIYLIKTYKTRNTCEDSYQNNRGMISKKNKARIALVAEYQSENDMIGLYELSSRAKPLNVLHHTIFTDKEEYRLCNEDTKALIDTEDKKIYLDLNHEVIGGSNIVYGACMVNKQKYQKDNCYKSRFWHILPFLKLAWNYSRIPRVDVPLPLFTNDNDVKRYQLKYSFIREKGHVKSKIIYEALSDIYKCLGLQRKMVCYLPIAFYSNKNIYNNIGIMWLTYDENDTIESIEKQMQTNTYQILATNFAIYNNLTKLNHGSSVRKSVDAVITVLFSEDEIDLSKSWTFEQVSEYPVYAAISSVLHVPTDEVIITRTLTVSTPAFDVTKTDMSYELKSKEYYLL